MTRSYIIVAAAMIGMIFTGLVFAAPQQLLATNGTDDSAQKTPTAIDSSSVDIQKIPTSIKKYELQEINAVSFRNSIEQGDPISIQFKGKTYELEISPDSKVRDDVKAYITMNGEKVEVPREDFGVYEGKVADISRSQVRLVVNTESVHGIVKTPEAYFYINPLTKFDQNADSDIHILYDRTDEEFEVDMRNDVIGNDISKQSTSDFWNTTPTSDFLIPRAYA